MLEGWLVAFLPQHCLNIYGNLILRTMQCYEISNCPISFLLDRGWFVVAAVLLLCWSRFPLLPLRSFLPLLHSYCIFSPAIFLFFLLLKTVWDWVIILFLHVIPYAFRGSSIFLPRTPFLFIFVSWSRGTCMWSGICSNFHMLCL